MNASHLTLLDTAPASMRAPLAWLKADATPTAFRACFLCAHGADEGIERVCTHPQLLDARYAPQPVAIVRAWGGGCGPNAECMQARSGD
jgi:hypothetical protein